MRGKGDLILTGQLGEVMKESARAAWTFARANADWLSNRPAGVRARHPRPRAGGSDPEGRSVGGNRDGHGDGVGPVGATGTARRRDDRRDRAEGARAADRRRQGEGPGRSRAGITDIVIPRERGRSRGSSAEVRKKIHVELVEDLGQVLAFTLRDASLENGRLVFRDEAGHAVDLGGPPH